MSNIFSFLIATDCHLGYEETDHVIGDDSFVTFEEILIKAVEEEVDLILLGGDLFHHNNPSQKCMHRCMELLRRYTLGDRPVYFELLCNAAEVLSNSVSQKTTNYLDENINVSIPVFSIHGNHDDPSGIAQACALDTLSSAGLLNYFGKWTNLEEIVIKPILFRKGNTKIALYGLSHIKDDRLCRLFINDRVKFIRPETDPNGWFNIFVLHQNRADRGVKRFISESYIPEFIDLVIWGHEHDCQIEPLQNLQKGFYVIQPGSSVPTSLSEGESLEKHVAVLEVYKKKMKVKPLKLNTVRPFVWRSVNLWETPDTLKKGLDREKKSIAIQAYCRDVVKEMLEDAKKLVTGHIKQPKLPLVRLRCLYDDETQLFNIVKFGQQFDKMVANPIGEIVRLKRSFAKVGVKKGTSEDLERLSELYKEDMKEAGNFTTCVNHIIKDYFTNHEDTKMLLLRVGEMGAAVESFMEKDDLFVIDELVDNRYKQLLKELTEQKVQIDEMNLKEFFESMRKEEEKLSLEEEKDLERKLEKVKLQGKRGTNEVSGRPKDDMEVDDFSDPDVFGKGNGGGKIISDSGTDEYDVEDELDVSDATRKKKNHLSENNEDELGFEARKKEGNSEGKSRGRGRGRGTGRRYRGGGAESKRERMRADTSSRKSPRGGGAKTRQPLRFQTGITYGSDSE